MKQLTAKELALYLGCEAEVEFNDMLNNEKVVKDKRLLNAYLLSYYDLYNSVKPLLRPISGITEEELNYIALELKAGTANVHFIKSWAHPWNGIHFTPEIFTYLLSKGFDLFNWIEQGLAIDKN